MLETLSLKIHKIKMLQAVLFDEKATFRYNIENVYKSQQETTGVVTWAPYMDLFDECSFKLAV